MQKTFLLFASVFLLLGGCEKLPHESVPASEAPDEMEPVTTVDGLTTVRMTGDDRMRFNLEAFTVPSGNTVRLVFENVGTMPKSSMGHNVVFLLPDTDENAFAAAAARARDNDYIPVESSGQILAHTRLLGPDGRDVIEFTAPEPGEYPFVCSFPAHMFAGMRGVMTVE